MRIRHDVISSDPVAVPRSPRPMEYSLSFDDMARDFKESRCKWIVGKNDEVTDDTLKPCIVDVVKQRQSNRPISMVVAVFQSGGEINRTHCQASSLSLARASSD